MKKFRFKLDVVLVERKRVEDQRLKDWTLAQRIFEGMLRQLRDLKERLNTVYGEANQAAAAPCGSTNLLSAMESFIKGQKIRIEWKTREIERGAKIVEKARLLYVTARQKREALEKLKERRLEEFKAAIRRRELKQLDDVYIMRAPLARAPQDEEAGE